MASLCGAASERMTDAPVSASFSPCLPPHLSPKPLCQGSGSPAPTARPGRQSRGERGLAGTLPRHPRNRDLFAGLGFKAERPRSAARWLRGRKEEGRGPPKSQRPRVGQAGAARAQARRPWGVACRRPGLAGGRTWTLLSGAGLLAGSTEGAGLTQRGGQREAFWEMETPRRALKLSRMTRKGKETPKGRGQW